MRYDVRRDVLQPTHSTTLAALKIKFLNFKILLEQKMHQEREYSRLGSSESVHDHK